MISGRLGIRNAYRDERVAREYVNTRFVEPLGALLHARQVNAVRQAIASHRAQRVLEIAPGPGRLTVDVMPAVERQGALAVLVEASAQMLAEARARLGDQRCCRLLQGDAFNLPLGAAFDLVYVFRLIRHFRAAERGAIYRQIAKVLKPGGILIFDAVNETVSAPLRANAHAGEYEHYDALMRPDVIESELRDAGLALVSLEGVQRRYPALAKLQTLIAPRSRLLARAAMEITDRLAGGPPLEWIVTCRRR
jgi:ubiquinone/menaquinone biosynthesis C-methylase UbiE